MSNTKGRTKASDDYKQDFKHSDQPKELGNFKDTKGTRSGLAKYRKKENMPDSKARKLLFDQLDAEAMRYGNKPVLEMSNGGRAGNARGYGCAVKGIKKTKNR